MTGIIRSLRKLRAQLRNPRPAIIMYHRVASVETDPWGLSVSPSNFQAQIAALQRRHLVLSTEDFIDQARRGTIASNAVTITFDDGYLDNLTNAAPILANAKLPATLFLATHIAEQGASYWWDVLASTVLDTPPVTGSVIIGNESVFIQLGVREPADDRRLNWRAWEPRTAREQLHYQLWNRIRPLDSDGIAAALLSLNEVFGPVTMELPRAMRLDEVAQLIATAPFTLGGHTNDHADLVTLPAEMVLNQIVDGRDVVRQIAGNDPAGFAYPYGSHNHFACAAVEAAGFTWACTTHHGHVSTAPDLYRLPRITAQDVANISWLV